jgi:hypothetical protein
MGRGRVERIPTTAELRALLGPLTFAVDVIHTTSVDDVENERVFSPGSSTPGTPVAKRASVTSPQIA